jgi:MerR family copper efflux transcriptional regulator
MMDLTIGRAAEAAGVGVETIRFYERRGLIEQPKKPLDSGFRIYSPEQVKRIRFIRQAQQLGFSLREIGELLALRADPHADCSEVRAQAVAKLQEVKRKIAQLQELGAALEALIAACPGQGGLQSCSILDTLVEPDLAIKGSGPLPAAPPKRKRQNGPDSRQRRRP